MNDNAFTTFGNVLKNERVKRGWTRIELYIKVNQLSRKKDQIISVESLARWENGKKLPRIEATFALAKVYKKPELINLRIQAIELKRKMIMCG